MRQPLAIIRGSGNVFADLSHPDARVQQAKAVLAAAIIKALDAAALTVRTAETCSGIAAAEFSRIRNADLGRFTVDRLIRILERLDDRVDVQMAVHRA